MIKLTHKAYLQPGRQYSLTHYISNKGVIPENYRGSTVMNSFAKLYATRLTNQPSMLVLD